MVIAHVQARQLQTLGKGPAFGGGSTLKMGAEITPGSRKNLFKNSKIVNNNNVIANIFEDLVCV